MHHTGNLAPHPSHTAVAGSQGATVLHAHTDTDTAAAAAAPISHLLEVQHVLHTGQALAQQLAAGRQRHGAGLGGVAQVAAPVGQHHQQVCADGVRVAVLCHCLLPLCDVPQLAACAQPTQQQARIQPNSRCESSNEHSKQTGVMLWVRCPPASLLAGNSTSTPSQAIQGKVKHTLVSSLCYACMPLQITCSQMRAGQAGPAHTHLLRVPMRRYRSDCASYGFCQRHSLCRLPSVPPRMPAAVP